MGESGRLRLTGPVDSIVASYLSGWREGFRHNIADLRRRPNADLGDLVGGVSVALVLIPQSLAYADLAGLPPYIGLFASAFPLLIFALLASSPYLQTGPVALTSLLTVGALTATGAVERTDEYIRLAALLALIVGGARLIIGALRLGAVVYLMAEPVMMGFTSGAGLVIIASQLPKAFGVIEPENVAAWSNPILPALWSIVHPGEWEFTSVAIASITLALMLGGRRVHRLFPGVLVAVVLALVYSELTSYDGPVVGEVDAGLPGFSIDLPWGSFWNLVVGGLVIALVGFAEPASIARTFANEDGAKWSSSREFVASGAANIVSGVTGAFPVGGSFSRSSVNRFAGARTRVSGGITGLVVLAFLPFAGLLQDLPLAVLGAIVVGAVYSLVRPARLVDIWRRSPWQASLAWITFIATLLAPPQVQYAVVIGVVLTFVFHFVRRFHIEVESTDSGQLNLRTRGLLWVLTNSRLERELREVIAADTGTGPVTLSLLRTTAIDGDIARSVAAGSQVAHDAGREFRVVDPPAGGKAILRKVGVDVA